MKDNMKMMGRALLGLLFAMILTLMIFFCLLCGGCTREVYVPVERVRTEYVQSDTNAIYNTLQRLIETRREKTSRFDSLIDREKHTIVINGQGDTTRNDTERIVFRSTAREKKLEVENKTLRDSLSVLNSRLESIKADSVPSIIPVERKLSKWEKAKMDFGGAAISVLAILVIVIAVKWLIKRYRK